MGVSQNIEKARRSLKVAEAMLSRSYPVSKDPKLFLAVCDDLLFALMECVGAVFALESRPLPADAGEAIGSFAEFAPKQGFSADDLALLRDMQGIILAHRESPVEFVRKDSFVICDEKYDFTRLTAESMQKFLFGARLFIERASAACERSAGSDAVHSRY
jgi:hypothetical protein